MEDDSTHRTFDIEKYGEKKNIDYTYDSSGNPKEYYNGMSFNWYRGRQLQEATLANGNRVTYKYNEDGLRTYKDTEKTTTTYEWDETKLIRETVTYKKTGKKYDIWYMYDSVNNVIGFEYSQLSEIQDNAYDELMNWLESKCDSFSFCLPHFGKVVVTESNADIYPEYEIGYVEEDEESKKDYEQYRRRVQKYLENISEYIIENYVDIEYCETISGYEKEIFIIKLNNITKKFFENVKDLYGWLYPEFPEHLT